MIFTPTTIKQLLKKKFTTPKWLVENLIPQAGATILSGQPASFKTWVTLHLTSCIVQGLPLFNEFKTIQKNVLLINEEDHESQLQERFAKLGNINPKSQLYILPRASFTVDNSEHMDWLIGYIDDKKIKVVIIDSLVRVHSKDENNSREMAEFFRSISKLTKLGVAVIITHHHNKSLHSINNQGQALRGSTDILAAIDCHLIIKKNGKDSATITQSKIRINKEIDPFKINVQDRKDGIKLLFQRALSSAEEIETMILNKLKAGAVAQSEIVDELNILYGKNSIGNAIKSLEQEKSITISREERGKKILSLTSNKADF